MVKTLQMNLMKKSPHLIILMAYLRKTYASWRKAHIAKIVTAVNGPVKGVRVNVFWSENLEARRSFFMADRNAYFWQHIKNLVRPSNFYMVECFEILKIAFSKIQDFLCGLKKSLKSSLKI